MDEDAVVTANPAPQPAPEPERAPERASEPAPGLAGGEDPAFVAKVVRTFIREDRLVSIPSRERRRQVIYRYLRDAVFTEDRAYEEKEVNMRLALFHPDVATLRRGMVDASLVTREAGWYRRGGD